MQRQRPRGNGFRVLVRDSQPHENRPPVVDQGRDARHHLAALPVVRGEACPSPLILQLVKIVFRVPAVPIMLLPPQLPRARAAATPLPAASCAIRSSAVPCPALATV